jgi:ribosome maturation factor RimP
VTKDPVNGQAHFSGRLAGVDDGAVLLREGRRTHRVPLDWISRARLDVEF